MNKDRTSEIECAATVRPFWCTYLPLRRTTFRRQRWRRRRRTGLCNWTGTSLGMDDLEVTIVWCVRNNNTNQSWLLNEIRCPRRLPCISSSRRTCRRDPHPEVTCNAESVMGGYYNFMFIQTSRGIAARICTHICLIMYQEGYVLAVSAIMKLIQDWLQNILYSLERGEKPNFTQSEVDIEPCTCYLVSWFLLPN